MPLAKKRGRVRGRAAPRSHRCCCDRVPRHRLRSARRARAEPGRGRHRAPSRRCSPSISSVPPSVRQRWQRIFRREAEEGPVAALLLRDRGMRGRYGDAAGGGCGEGRRCSSAGGEGFASAALGETVLAAIGLRPADRGDGRRARQALARLVMSRGLRWAVRWVSTRWARRSRRCCSVSSPFRWSASRAPCSS